MSIIDLTHDKQWVIVDYSDGRTQRYLGTWLRDNVGTGRHLSQGQRTFDINLLDDAIITGASFSEDQVRVSFNNEPAQYGFDEGWLRSYSNDGPQLRMPTLWDSALQSNLEFIDFESARADPALRLKLLSRINEIGFALIENVPCVEGAIFDVVDLFGYVRKTNYGSLFDVRVEPNPANLAFTSAEIGMHTDNPYRDPVPGLQLLHCLVNDSDGGENQLVDGFKVAEDMRVSHPDEFELLRTVAVDFRYYEAGVADLRNRTPLISVRDGRVCEVRYNARSIQAFNISADLIEHYYAAYRIFGRALHDSAARVEFRLEPGQLMIFDNQRILHGRSVYHQGARHLQGCYADKDSLQSETRILEEG